MVITFARPTENVGEAKINDPLMVVMMENIIYVLDASMSLLNLR